LFLPNRRFNLSAKSPDWWLKQVKTRFAKHWKVFSQCRVENLGQFEDREKCPKDTWVHFLLLVKSLKVDRTYMWLLWLPLIQFCWWSVKFAKNQFTREHQQLLPPRYRCLNSMITFFLVVRATLWEREVLDWSIFLTSRVLYRCWHLLA